jgi:hypothetical protein
MKKIIIALFSAAAFFTLIGMALAADTITLPTSLPTSVQGPLESVTSEFTASLASHVSAVDTFRQDGTHIIEFTDALLEAVPFEMKGSTNPCNLLEFTFGLVPAQDSSTTFYKSYGVHAHVVGYLSQFVTVNPTYASYLNDLELTPGYEYATDVHHGGLVFSVGYSHKFGGTPAAQ